MATLRSCRLVTGYAEIEDFAAKLLDGMHAIER